ncbi:MAG: sigma-70 family RNA polymerase sigma factor [Ruminococcaceae bacterium]|nr:sigma-70 family RNA polymerase sigma factor [Oscillospiraceae bacterium]
MTAQEYLKKLNRINDRIREAEVSYMLLETQATKTTRQYPKAVYQKGSPDYHRREKVIAAMADMGVEIDNSRLELIELKREARQLFMSLDDSRYSSLLEFRYIDGLKWKEVGEIMNYSERHVKRLYADAVNALDKKLTELKAL